MLFLSSLASLVEFLNEAGKIVIAKAVERANFIFAAFIPFHRNINLSQWTRTRLSLSTFKIYLTGTNTEFIT